MQVPQSQCALIKIIEHPGKSEIFERIVKRAILSGSFAIRPCDCNPGCRDLTNRDLDKLTQKLIGNG